LERPPLKKPPLEPPPLEVFSLELPPLEPPPLELPPLPLPPSWWIVLKCYWGCTKKYFFFFTCQKLHVNSFRIVIIKNKFVVKGVNLWGVVFIVLKVIKYLLSNSSNFFIVSLYLEWKK
jgi:hypothetical protein